ncbi:MAG: YdiU family protein, partial [Parvularculaceae bacterium]|nr:YdiU family protein [Parvularculaceae bacterium]
YEGDADAIARLVDYCVEAFDPDLCALERPEKTAQFFARVVARTARLVSQWMAAGFVHGVLNTDNMNVTGESFDYGPWRFLPAADFTFTAAYFDQDGLYAYGRQPEAALWNLSRFGGTLVAQTSELALNSALQSFSAMFEAGMTESFFRRLGVAPSGEDDFRFVMGLMQWMEKTGAPFERVFFDWFCGKESGARAEMSPFAPLYAETDFAPLKERLVGYAPVGAERLSHPYFSGAPSTMLIDEVEAIWAAIAERDDWSLLQSKLQDIAFMREALALDGSRFVAAPFQ